MKHLQAGLIQGVSLGLPGLLLGVLAGWLGLWRAEGVDAIASVVVKVYLALVLLLPGTLAFWTLANLNDEDWVLYQSLPGSMVMLLLGALLGTLVATGFFMVVAINVPAIFGGKDQVALRLSLMAQLGWTRVLVVAGITAVSSIPLAFWGHRQVRPPDE